MSGLHTHGGDAAHSHGDGNDHSHAGNDHSHAGHDHSHGGHSHGAGHGHHGHHHGPPPDGMNGRYLAGIGLNLIFVAAEVVAGFMANSTALLADAGHNMSDVLALVLAAGAAWLAKKPGHERRTYGFGKATILAALTNSIVLVFACGAIALEAVRRFAEPASVQPGLVMIVAGVGFFINVATALLFMRGRHDDLNIRGAFLHMAADAGVSLAVVVSGLMIFATGLSWIDPVASLVVVAVILVGSRGVLKESFDLAMDVAPSNIDVSEIRAYLTGLPGVQAVHDMHIWSLSTTQTALTCHLVRATLADASFLNSTAGELKSRFGIGHATLQVEHDAQDNCPDC